MRKHFERALLVSLPSIILGICIYHFDDPTIGVAIIIGSSSVTLVTVMILAVKQVTVSTVPQPPTQHYLPSPPPAPPPTEVEVMIMEDQNVCIGKNDDNVTIVVIQP